MQKVNPQREMGNRIIALMLKKVPPRYNTATGRWTWIAGFLAGWLARIVISDRSVRRELEQMEEDAGGWWASVQNCAEVCKTVKIELEYSNYAYHRYGPVKFFLH